MTLNEYIELRLKEIKAMKEYWLANHEKDPDDYPMEMPEGEWFEQESAFVDLEYTRDVE